MGGFRVISGELVAFRRSSSTFSEAVEKTALEMNSLDHREVKEFPEAVSDSKAASERLHTSAKELLCVRACIHPLHTYLSSFSRKPEMATVWGFWCLLGFGLVWVFCRLVGWVGFCLGFWLVWFDLGLALFVCGVFYVVFLCVCTVGFFCVFVFKSVLEFLLFSTAWIRPCAYIGQKTHKRAGQQLKCLGACSMSKGGETFRFLGATWTMQTCTLAGLGPSAGRRDAAAPFGVRWEALSLTWRRSRRCGLGAKARIWIRAAAG